MFFLCNVVLKLLFRLDLTVNKGDIFELVKMELAILDLMGIRNDFFVNQFSIGLD